MTYECDEGKLTAIIAAADQSGLTVDVLVSLADGLDESATAILCGNVSRLPQYIKSSEMPYTSRSRIAALRDGR